MVVLRWILKVGRESWMVYTKHLRRMTSFFIEKRPGSGALLIAGVVGAGLITKWAHGNGDSLPVTLLDIPWPWVVSAEKQKHSNDKFKSIPLVSKEEEIRVTAHLTPRERRFIRFASVECGGQIYMTPQDFLESVTDSEPRPRLKRRRLLKKDLDTIWESTPPRTKGNTKLFRTLGDTGIISCTEYLFLLSVLTKPHSGFRLAFNMFDTDGNQRVDKEEFLVLERIFATVAYKAHMLKRPEKEPSTNDNNSNSIPAVIDTTLLIHLFGKKGDEVLSFADFFKFMDNLQTEVLELEFTEFSRGMPEISEVDFARILLRYTYVHSDDYEAYIRRVQDRIPAEKGVSFQQFKTFCQFLNNLEDFAIAMRMFTYANQPISQEEFHRAVQICTGQNLDSHLVDTVFQIFDEDGDGQLSYKEFIAIMRDRLHRGFRSHVVKSEGWEAFKSCVKGEMRS